MINNCSKWLWILMFSDVTQLSFMPSFNFMAFYQKSFINAFMNHWRKSKLHSIFYATKVFMAVNHWSFAHFLRIKHFNSCIHEAKLHRLFLVSLLQKYFYAIVNHSSFQKFLRITYFSWQSFVNYFQVNFHSDDAAISRQKILMEWSCQLENNIYRTFILNLSFYSLYTTSPQGINKLSMKWPNDIFDPVQLYNIKNLCLRDVKEILLQLVIHDWLPFVVNLWWLYICNLNMNALI